MSLSKQQVNHLKKIISTAQKLLNAAPAAAFDATDRPRRNRRSTADAEKMRAEIRKARTKGVPVAKLAKKYGVSSAYIYMMK